MSVRHIAKQLGISPSAVSLALHGSRKVSAAMRARVEAEAQRISYRPSGKVAELMSLLRAGKVSRDQACFAVMSLYPEPRPWEKSRHHSLIFESMNKRAEMLGYRLEPMWLGEPGMSCKRFRNILDARGIEGLVCFGSPNRNDVFPLELDHYAIVTIGLSINTPMHRVISNFYNDTVFALNKAHALGYRRPGHISGEATSSARSRSAYLGWCDINLGPKSALPVLDFESCSKRKLLAWLKEYEPDVLILAQGEQGIQRFKRFMKSVGIRVPEDIGVAAITHVLEPGGYSGIQQNQELMGAWAIELLVSRILNHDFGIPTHPRLEVVDGQWVDGFSL